MNKKILLILLAINLTGLKTSACIMINASADSIVLIGNNEDWNDPNTKMWIFPSSGNKFGGVYFGYSSDIQGGINDKGLVYDGLAAPHLKLKESNNKALTSVMDIMENCSSVDEVISYLSSHSLKGYIENGQLMFSDKTGKSIIVEGDIIHIKTNDFQVATNFYLSQYHNKDIDCSRYKIAQNILEKNSVSIETMKKVLAATHQETDEGGTVYSNIYDPINGKIYLYHFHNFMDEVIIDVNEILRKGKQEVAIPTLFEENFSYNFYSDRFNNRQKEKILKIENENSTKKVYNNYENPNPETPTEIILTAYFLANKGEYDKATSFLSSEVQNKLSKGFYKLVGGAEGGWNYGTNKRSLIEIRIIQEEINNKKAIVRFISTFENGKKRETVDELILEEGHWRIN